MIGKGLSDRQVRDSFGGTNITAKRVGRVRRKMAAERERLRAGKTPREKRPGNRKKVQRWRAALLQRDGPICPGCQRDFTGFIDLLEVDHRVPLSYGGDHRRSNLQLLCSTCNRSKGGATMERFMERGGGKKMLREHAKALPSELSDLAQSD